MTALVDPVVHQRLHRLTEIVSSEAHRSVVSVFAYEWVRGSGARRRGRPRRRGMLEHADDGGALLVGEEVEHRLGLVGRHDRELDWSCRCECIDIERGGSSASERLPDAPVRTVGIATTGLHKGCEGLVEPDALPPLHRDKIAEPHVGQFVVDDVGGPLQFRLACVGRVDDQQHLAERHAAEVFHRAERSRGWRSGRPCRRGRGLRSSRQTSRGLRRRHRGRTRCGRPDRGGGRHGWAHRPHGSVRWPPTGRRQRRRGRSTSPSSGRTECGDGHRRGGLGDLARVGDGEMVGIDDQRCLEGRLVLGLVPTREATASVGRLELGGGDRVLGAVVGGVRRSIEAVKLIVEVPSNVTCTVAGLRRPRRRG